ncbi:amino acid carrier protein [Gleimia hominis]|uniref:Amino acid carrier protein n=1 Tax=Gleimia hominis TaxID=595468 RepID=A0ABU3ICH1_9ACTO|nr:amino acid carrier protein [Gleimia hominis]MDT3767958.1 amino acid carrier protein [Gleimia hominis]
MTTVMNGVASAVQWAAQMLYSWVLVFLLIGMGIYLTIYMRGVQIRHFPNMIRALKGARSIKGQEVSSFQAFAVGLGTRIGIGNIGGVALALIMGGPGAIFWMWIVAAVGMATSFVECVLAQIFKSEVEPGIYRGGPAYYISRALGWKRVAAVSACISVVASGLAVPMVQVNTVASTLGANHGVPTWVTMLIFLVLLAPVILGGMYSVARASEYLTPIMAGVYILVTIAVLALNPAAAAAAFGWIITAAFGPTQVAGGVTGGLFIALVNGARRGLFSNEAGLGTTPNNAGAATVAHPVQQGLVQSLGVFIDTIVVCTATALLILVSGAYHPAMPTQAAGSLTAQAVTSSLGSWMALPMSLMIFVFGYTSAYGAYSHGQVALDHLSRRPTVTLVYRAAAVLAASAGAIVNLPVAWALSDLLLGLGAIINLVAIVVLVRWVRLVLQDWESLKRRGKPLVFNANRYPELRELTQEGVWNGELR